MFGPAGGHPMTGGLWRFILTGAIVLTGGGLPPASSSLQAEALFPPPIIGGCPQFPFLSGPGVLCEDFDTERNGVPGFQFTRLPTDLSGGLSCLAGDLLCASGDPDDDVLGYTQDTGAIPAGTGGRECLRDALFAQPTCSRPVAEENDWHLHSPSEGPGEGYDPPGRPGIGAPDGGKARSGIRSMHMGRHLDALSTLDDTTRFRQVSAFVLDPPVTLGPESTMEFWQIIRTTDDDSFGFLQPGTTFGGGQVQISLQGQDGRFRKWEPLTPSFNGYNSTIQENVTICTFDPGDDSIPPDDETLCNAAPVWSDIGDPVGNDASCTVDTDGQDPDDLDCGEISSCTGGPGCTENGSTGDGVWARSAFDLSPYAGREARLRWIATIGGGWSFGTSRSLMEPEVALPYPYLGDEGWWIDDVVLTDLRVPPRILIGAGSQALTGQVVPVTVLGLAGVDASNVDGTSARFGPAQAEPIHDQSDPGVALRHLKDVDHDGVVDYVLHFHLEETGIQAVDTSACLTARSFADDPILACETLRSSDQACPPNPRNDPDRDGVCDFRDNCPGVSNRQQLDTDGDGAGDPCDPCPLSAVDDIDDDGFCGDVDNCPVDFNPGQEDADEDGLGEPCDSCPMDPLNDIDEDGICGDVDDCPLDPGDDEDGDGLCGEQDPCPIDADNDIDEDGFCADMDNCPVDTNPDQADSDDDGIGDVCDLFAPGVVITTSLGDPSPADPRVPLEAADIDGDGDQDLVLGSGLFVGDRPLIWLENAKGDGSMWVSHTIKLGEVREIAVVDVDGDSDLDVIANDSSNSDITWLENVAGDGSGWTEHPINSQTGISMAVGDIDRDGDMDVVSRERRQVDPDRLSWFENPSWTPHPIMALSSVVNELVVAKLADTIDVIASVRSSLRATLRVADYRRRPEFGPNAWIELEIPAAQLVGPQFFPADIDGNGGIDLLTSSQDLSPSNARLSWQQNLPGDDWAEHIIHRGFGSYLTAHGADIDGDGDFDALTGTSSPDQISWYRNIAGNGTEWVLRPIVLSLPGVPRATLAVDIDGDGDTDVVGAFGDRVEWYENTGPVASPARD